MDKTGPDALGIVRQRLDTLDPADGRGQCLLGEDLKVFRCNCAGSRAQQSWRAAA